METLPSIFSLFKESFKIYKKYFWGLIGISVFLIFLILLDIFYIFHSLKAILTPNQILTSNIIYQAIITLGSSIFFTIISLVLICAIKIYISSEQKVKKIICWKKGISLILPFFWIIILSFLVLVGGFYLLIIPGIIITISLTFICYTLVFENQKGLNSLLRSFQLIKGNWWRVFWRILCLMLCLILCLIFLTLLIYFILNNKIILSLLDKTSLELLKFIITIVIFFLITPPLILPLILIYGYLIFDALVKQKPLETFNPQKKRKFFIALAIWGFLNIIAFSVILFQLLFQKRSIFFFL